MTVVEVVNAILREVAGRDDRVPLRVLVVPSGLPRGEVLGAVWHQDGAVVMSVSSGPDKSRIMGALGGTQ